MTFGEKLAKLRKESNYTQEQLADLLEVTRQSVSKWESDLSYPETEKMIRIAELFYCSIDYLMKEDCDDRGDAENDKTANLDICKFIKRQFKERKSRKTVFGIPLYHFGKDARGFFAIGLNAKGIIAIGFVSRGIISLGLLSLGVFSFGLLSLGAAAFGVLALGLFSAGAISVGIISAGAISLGVVTFGALSIGEFSVGALAIGKYFAIGDHARALIAIGDSEATGELFSHLGRLTPSDIATVSELLDKNVPTYLNWAKEIIKLFII